jgi:hypothetical protein
LQDSKSQPYSPHAFVDAGRIMKFIISLFLFIALMAIIGSGSDKKQVTGRAQQQTQFQPKPSFMDDVNQKVISDAEEEYQIANRSGNATDRCVHAGIVAAAYIQAHDQSGYQRWKMRQDSDCQR